MARSLNQCNFIGNITRDIELRYASSGTAIANFSIACNDSYKNKDTGEQVDTTEFVNIVAFGKLAEIMGQYLSKGSKVYIEGKMKTDKYDKEGQTHYSTKIVANNMLMLDSKNQGALKQQASTAAQQGRPAQSAPTPVDADFDDDIPF